MGVILQVRYLSDLSDRFNVIASGHLVQKPINPVLCDASTALDKLLYAKGESGHNFS